MNSRRLKIAAAGALAAGTAASQGTVVIYDFPDVTYDNLGSFGGVSFKLINPATAGYQTGLAAQGEFPSFTAFTDYYYGFGIFGFDVGAAQTSGRATMFNPGAVISSALNFTANGIGAYRYGSEMPRSTFFLGLKLTKAGQDYLGWLELTSSDYTSYGYTAVTFKRFAFNDVAGESITTPGTPVPEASTLGFVGGLFGLAVAAHLRRRKLKQAAASDKFLALAAGESVRG